MILDISTFILAEDFPHDGLAIRISATIMNELPHTNTHIHVHVCMLTHTAAQGIAFMHSFML